MMQPWGTGWSEWLTLCAAYIGGVDRPGGCAGMIEWIDQHVAGGDTIADACPSGVGTIMGWTIECNGQVVGQSGVTTAPYSSVHSLPGPPSGHAQLTLWIACGG